MWVGLVLIVPEQNLLAIGEEDIRDIIELLGIASALAGRFLQVDRGPLGLDHRHQCRT